MNIIRKLPTLLSILTVWPLYWASSLVPKDPHRWVFIGWHEGDASEIFADNTKYLFLHASGVKSIRAVWLARDEELAELLRARGFAAYRAQSLRGIWTALRAGCTFVDAYLARENFRWSGGSTLVQLLHGKGMKKGGYAKPQYRKHDVIFGPSQYVLDLLPRSFTDGARMVVSGYPRDDIFFRDVKGSDISVDEKAQRALDAAGKSGKKALLYAPTYRRGETTLDLEQAFDLSLADAWCAKRGFELFVSLHPKYRRQERSRGFVHVHFVPESDLYPLLPSFSLVITDYSSIFTDLLLIDTPLVFYPYDLETYREREGFGVDYDSHTPGEKAYSFPELLSAIERTLESDTYAEERARVRSLYHAYTDGKASMRIVNELLAR